MNKRVLLIDLSHLFWACWHASSDKEISYAFNWTIKRVGELASGFEHVAIACDCPPYLRRQEYPEYKAQREAQPQHAIEQFRRVQDRLVADGRLLWKVQGYEADDIIATACRHARDNEYGVTIATNDKDLLQLVSDAFDICVLSTRDNAELREEQVKEKFGIEPWQMTDFLALTGDKSDNIPGCPGIGPKWAAKLLNENGGELTALLSRVAFVKPDGMREKLFDNAELIRLSRKLVMLREDAPIVWAQLFERREQKPLAKPPAPSREWDEAEYQDVEDPEPEPEPEQKSAPQQQRPKSEPPPAPAAKVAEGRFEEPRQQAPKQQAPRVEQSTALVRVESREWMMSLEPSRINGARDLACWMQDSRLFPQFPNEHAILAVIMRGRDLGMGAIAALQSFHYHDGHLTMHAHLISARAKSHPDCEYFQFVGGDDTFAEYETKHRRDPKPTRLRYTIEQAQRAGLVRKTRSGADSNWIRIPAEMLRKTCAVQLTRIVYPESAMGLYSPEEFGIDSDAA